MFPLLYPQAYAKCGADREAQTKFRAAWVANAWQEISRRKEHTNTQHKAKENKAVFYPIPVWLQKEGGGQEAVDGLTSNITGAKTIHHSFIFEKASSLKIKWNSYC